jgi:hypothetical protein
MGTRGYYAFRYKRKYYVFYNHFDSYWSGLGSKIIKELQTWDDATVQLVMKALNLITEPEAHEGSSTFESMQAAAERPHDF